MTTGDIRPRPIEAMLAALDDVYFVPESHSRCDVTEAEARPILDCDDAGLAALVQNGLPSAVVDGVRRFDQCDLFNLALRAGAGNTPPEIAFRFALRWMSAATDEMLAERRWAFAADVCCPLGEDCGGDSALAVPVPQIYGGELRTDGALPEPDSDGRIHRGRTGAASLHAKIRLAGAMTEIADPVIRDIYGSFLQRPPRWVKLPAAIQADLAQLESRNVATCVSASLALERDFNGAGLTARTRRGWVLGMLDLVHAWVEVKQRDGTVVVIDPIFALFSTMVPSANPSLRQSHVSIRTNRILPTPMSATAPVAVHRCADASTPPKVHIRVAPEPETADLRRR